MNNRMKNCLTLSKKRCMSKVSISKDNEKILEDLGMLYWFEYYNNYQYSVHQNLSSERPRHILQQEPFKLIRRTAALVELESLWMSWIEMIRWKCFKRQSNKPQDMHCAHQNRRIGYHQLRHQARPWTLYTRTSELRHSCQHCCVKSGQLMVNNMYHGHFPKSLICNWHIK